MNRKDTVPAIHNSMYQQLKKYGYATTVQTFMDLNILSKKDYELWRNGKVNYLEKVCKINLGRINFIMKEMRHMEKNRFERIIYLL